MLEIDRTCSDDSSIIEKEKKRCVTSDKKTCCGSESCNCHDKAGE